MLIREKEVVKVVEAARISEEERKQVENDNHHLYMMRHDDDGDWSVPVTIEQNVLVNYWGYLITKEPLDNPGPDPLCIELTEDEGYDLAEWREGKTA